ncbi:MAG TPA: COX15/CtaA family protein [Flavobacterium sp.]|nr:COX15/CtaA family protein [Flavobacterium sp.]
MKRHFPTITKTALVLVYLVILAGALVRMTGSGMGCPDWPKCFGYYIPPTHISELTWLPNRNFEKGQVIIRGEKLLVAQDSFNSGTRFDESHWKAYTKHDYAVFNPAHTWVEYINRLLGALAGLACFLMAVASFWQWKTDKKITLLSWLAVFLMGFQAWLGATVVYSVLNPIKITIHMVAALAIACLILYILYLARPKAASVFKFNKSFDRLLAISLLLTLCQIILGTQVRQFVDQQVKLKGYEVLAAVLEDPVIEFYFHRSFSFAVLAANIMLMARNRKLQLGFKKLNWVLFLMGASVFSGIAMYWYGFPAGSQTIHLLAAALLFGVQFYLILESKAARRLK